MAQIGIPINGNTYDASLASRWLYGRTNGVFSSDTDLLVTPSTGMTVDISTGAAWMAPSQFVNCCYTNDAVETLTFSLAGDYLPRIDRIVVRWDVTDVATHPYLLIKTGTYAASPTAPAVERTATGWELAIADVRIAAGATQITQSMITDKRLDESVCGIVSSGIDAIPTQSLHDSFMAWWTNFQGDLETKASVFEAWITDFQTGNTTDFNTWLANFQSTASTNWNSWYSTNTTNFADQFNSWFADLQDVLDENQATNLYNKIDAHEQLTMVTGEPHGTRLNNGRFQVYDGVGWVTLATFQQGYTAEYADALQRTAMAFDLLQLTAAQFDALIERED